MVRIIEGHGRLMTRNPPSLVPTDFPERSTISASIPGSGRVADPGFAGTAPGTGAIIIAPVSVCHQVSTMGHRSPPMCFRYHIQASGLMGSPTVPSRRRLDRSCFAGHSSPHLVNALIAVGAV